MIGNKLVAVFLSFVMLAGIGVVVTAAVPASFGFTFVSANTLSPKLLSSVARGDGEIDILIETNSGDYGSLVNLIETQGGVVTQQFRYIDAIAASLPRSVALTLSSHRNVARMYVDDILMPAVSPGMSSALPNLEGLANPMALETEGLQVVDLTAEELLALEPENYWNNIAASASPVWGATGLGADTTVAIIDTGIFSSHFLIGPSRIVGGVDVSPDVGGPFEGFDLPTNHWHGSFVASTAGGFGAVFALGVFAFIADSIEFNTGVPLPTVGGIRIIPLLGIAPFIDFFIAKVFPHTGAGVPSSIVIAGIEAVISARVDDGVDIDVMNLSLGGAVLFDGRDLSDQAIDAATAVGITPVIAAGNSGPASATVSSPGTSNTAITVAAASDAVHTRVFWDFVFFVVGAGACCLRVSDETQVIGFSSTGPTADGDDDPRLFGKPDMMATGFVTLAAFPVGGSTTGLAFASGTSFSTPGVAGGVALLNSFAESTPGFSSATPFDYKQAMLAGASPVPDFGPDDQGAGYIDVTASLSDLIAQGTSGGLGDVQPSLATEIEEDTFDLENIDLDDDVFETSVSLAPGLKEEFIFEVERVEFIEVSVTDVDTGAFDPLGINSFELYIQSAKRSTDDYFIDSANVFGDSTVTITDDATTFSGAIFPFDLNSHVVEPGFVKVVLENDHTSADVVSGDLRIEVEDKSVDDDEDIDDEILQGELLVFFQDVPEGTTSLVIELDWERNWQEYPASDLDFIAFSDAGIAFGLSLNVPERDVLVAPPGVEFGTLVILVFGFEVNPFGAEEEFEIEFQFFGDDD